MESSNNKEVNESNNINAQNNSNVIKNKVSGLKRKRLDDESKDFNKNKRSKHSSGLFKTILNHESSDSDKSSNSDESDSSEYDFIKKAKQSHKANSSSNGLIEGLANKAKTDNIKQALNETNKVAQEIFSILPGAKLSKGEKVMSISGGLHQNREIQFAERTKISSKTHDYELQQDDGIITINKSELVNKEDYEREKMRQLSRAEFQQERIERMSRLMPNKNDRSKNNLRSLAFDISGTLEQDRIQSQKTFQNAKKKYGW